MLLVCNTECKHYFGSFTQGTDLAQLCSLKEFEGDVAGQCTYIIDCMGQKKVRSCFNMAEKNITVLKH